ncbi:ABC-F family ATP-binding cassette domain-containing protein [Aestuariimicrobium kwangyangense]|uniref:ABC-F family ATP-binding cassette domain-containing protein n=1 Tax=Aestuariimicrobium kwangyangense TaxID=396389 RepID=UPI0003B6375E|nr:ABC-F family ATP-binding cassette domain-containing protein [Aestuariimicrobium kwangyangense]
MAAGPNLVNAEKVTKTYGTRTLLDEVSLGIGAGDVIGVVGRNGDGKSTLLGLLTGTVEPDSGRITQTGNVSIGVLTQAEVEVPPTTPGHLPTVRDLIVHGEPDHVWAADSYRRTVVTELLDGIGLDQPLATLSGGERRRAALVAMLLGDHDLLVLDEPTNHLDVEAVAWLAQHLRTLQQRGTAMLVVSHDRWFLDSVCTRIWEVHDASVDAYEGGYAAYVLARVERDRQAQATEQRRKNLATKELAWLRRGPPARTSKPRFRIDAANSLIQDVPAPRDRMQLQEFAVARLGKDVVDAVRASVVLPDGRVLLDQLDWSIGPGDRIGLVGVNGAGKSTLLRLLAGEQQPTGGRVKHGKTLRLGHLSQLVGELDDGERVLDSVNRLKQETTDATGKQLTASTLLEDFGFTGQKLVTRIGELSGGERRRLQFLRLLLAEPNVLFLDEPTNDLDIDTLNVIEDHLDSWPGTLVVVSHDRYFLERVCDVTYALLGDGSCVLLPGGVDEYLERRRAGTAGTATRPAADAGPNESTRPGLSGAELRAAQKELVAMERRMGRLHQLIDSARTALADHDPTDYVGLGVAMQKITAHEAELSSLEERWMELGEELESAAS